MKQEKLWINLKYENGEPLDKKAIDEFTKQVQEYFREKDVIVTVGEMNTISEEDAQEIAESLKEALE